MMDDLTQVMINNITNDNRMADGNAGLKVRERTLLISMYSNCDIHKCVN